MAMSLDQALNLGIQDLVILEINSNSIEFGDISPQDQPKILVAATVLNVKCNHKNNWQLRTYGQGDLVSSEAPAETIPLSQLKYRAGDISYFKSFSVAPQVIKTGPTGTENISVDYQLSVTYDDASATAYSTRVTYELLAN